jgi:outer membrane protein OmpA-like peptidoglycan-associated protein
VAFAVGGRANTPAVTGTPVLSAVVQAAATNEASVTLLDTGGQPAAEGPYELTLDSKNGAARQREAERNAGLLAQQVMQVAATAPEANPLEGLNMAADSIRSARGDTPGGTIVLVDSGLQTTGALDYTQEGMLSADPQDVVRALSATGQLPDLTGMTVYLVGVGQTVPPQEPLDAGSRHDVQAQWRALVEASGAACVAFDDTPRSAPQADGLPSVTPFEAPEVLASIPTPEQPLFLRDEIRFKSNSAEYVDPQRAAEALRPIADWMKQSGSTVTLTGTTATDGTQEGRKRLSLMRADAVKASLVALGAAPSRIATEGVGTDHPTHVDDLGPNGELLPGPAAQNRLVIVSVDS